MPLIHAKLDSSSVNGPGSRAVIHFQGCSLGCKGCWNPQTWTFDNATETSLSELVDWVKELTDIEGVTFSGGEPMQQAQFLFLLINEIKKYRPELTLGMFTGYTYKELEQGRFKWKSAHDASWKAGDPELWLEIKKHLDFAIMGRYNQLVKSTEQPMLGSLNQEVKFFTNKYSDKDLQPQGVEITIDDEGLVQISGFPPPSFREGYPIPGDTEVEGSTQIQREPELVLANPTVSTKDKDDDDCADDLACV